MPFQLPEPLSNWLEHRRARAKIDRLMSTVNELRSFSGQADSALSGLLQKHIQQAEDECQSALVEYKDNVEECMRRIEFGLFRLDLAKQQLSVAEEKKFQVTFDENTAEHGALMLAGAITRTKLAVEYSNCVVSEPIRRNLIGVVTMFNDAVDMIRQNKLAMSKRTSEGGLLMLYILERQIELENRQSIVDLKHIPRFASKESKKIKDALDLICNFKEMCNDSQRPVSLRVLKHLDSAVENYYLTVQAFVDEDAELVDKLTTTIRMQVEFANRLFRGSISKQDTGIECEEDGDALDRRLAEFKTRILKLRRIAARQCSDFDPLDARLCAARHNYVSAILAYRDCNLDEAERLRSAARSEIGSARQLYFSDLEVGSAEPGGANVP